MKIIGHLTTGRPERLLITVGRNNVVRAEHQRWVEGLHVNDLPEGGLYDQHGNAVYITLSKAEVQQLIAYLDDVMG